MATIDEMIAKSVSKVVEAELKRLLQPLHKQINDISKKLDKLNNEESTEHERLITISEASDRLKVNINTINKMISSGIIISKHTPNGRRKILESSLNNYLRGDQAG